MSLRVVSTKLTEEEHRKLLDACNRDGCTPSSFTKQAIMEKIESESPTKVKSKSLDEMSLHELYEACVKDLSKENKT